MKKFFNKYFWTLLIVLAAIGLAGSAAYFSITGLSKLFGGAAMEVIIMASFIEFGKLVTTAALHRYWKQTKWWMKSVLTAMVLAVMMITSMGIYGFLSDAYATTSVELEKIEGKIQLIEKQQDQKKVQIEGIEEIKTSKSDRVVTLNDLRGQQEARLDSLYNKGWYSSAKKTQVLIEESTAEIKSLQIELDSIANKINGINEEVGLLDIDILELQNSDVATEIGPLKYMSTVLNKPMESIINYFILMLIFVFDPLAVLLVIFASNVYDANNGKKEDEVEDEGETFLSKLKSKISKPKVEAPEEEVPEELVEAEEELEEESENNYQKVVDAINEDDDVLDFSYDFPEEKGDEVIEYIEGADGVFEKTDEPSETLANLIKGIDSNPIYLQLLDVLFLEGQRVSGDIIPPYKELVKSIADRGIVCEDKVIKNFLTICNLLDITNMSDKDSVRLVKDYSTSKGIVSLVSK